MEAVKKSKSSFVDHNPQKNEQSDQLVSIQQHRSYQIPELQSVVSEVDEEEEEEEDVEKITERLLLNSMEKEKEISRQHHSIEMNPHFRDIDPDNCILCRKQFKTPGMTILECGRHKLHNACAYGFMSIATISECILCKPRHTPKQIFSSSARDYTKANEQMRVNPFDLGNDIFLTLNARARSTLYQTLGEYKKNFSIPSTREYLTMTPVSNSSDIPTAVTIVKTVLNVCKEGLDWDIEKRAHEYRLINHYGSPVDVLRSGSLDISQLKSAGVNSTSLLFYNVPISLFFEVGYTIETLAALGIKLLHMLSLGLNANVWKLHHKTISIAQFIQYYSIDWTWVISEVCSSDLLLCSTIGWTFEELYSLKMTVASLSWYTFTWKILCNFKLSFEQWCKLGLTKNVLAKMGVPFEKLEKHFNKMGFNEEVFKTNFKIRNINEYVELVAHYKK